MKRGQPIMLRRFECPICGLKLSACKKDGVTGKGHVKTMWCTVCRSERDFVQIDMDRARV